MKKRILAFTLALIMLGTLLTGCGSSQSKDATTSQAQPAAGGAASNVVVEVEEGFDYSAWLNEDGKTVVRVATTADPGTFDPQQTPASAALTARWDETLCYIDSETWEVKPWLAESYEIAEDGASVYVVLHDNIYDSIGNHITSADVEYCYAAAKESGAANSSGVDHVEVLNDYELIIHLSQAQVGIWPTVCTFQIYSKESYESNDFATNPIGTGPYVLTNWVAGSSYTFEKRDDYWQTDENQIVPPAKANVDVIVYDVIKEPAQQAIQLELGTLDMVNGLSYTEAARFMEGGENEGTHNVYVYDSILAQLMYLNMSDNDFLAGDLNLRKAIFHCINRADLILGASNGYGTECVTFGCEAGSLGFLEKWYDEDYYTYDLEYAKECLANSNYAGQSVRIVSNNSDLKKAQSQLIQLMLLSVGINAECLPYEDALFNTYKNDDTQWEILIDNTSSGAELANMWRRKLDPNNFKNDQGGANFMHNDELNALLWECIDLATYSDETVDAYHQALKEEYSCMGLYNPKNFDVCSVVVTDTYNDSTGKLLVNACTFVWNE